MVIVLSLYALLVYLVFGVFKWLPWNGVWKTAVAVIGLIIALVVIGALNYLTPSGRVTVQGATIEITPNVSGTVVEVTAEANKHVEQGDLLFRIDPVPFAAEVARLEAALVEAKAAASRLQADLAGADADIQRLNAQLQFGIERRDDIVRLAERGASAEFQMQEAVANIEQLEASLEAALATKLGIEIQIASQVNGVNASVVQAEQALLSAQWSLAQTEVSAPASGMVTAMTLRAGQRVTSFQSAAAFVPDEKRALTGVFSQSGAHAFKVGSEVLVALQAMPGTSFTTTVESLVPGTAEGTLGGATGALPSIGQLLGANQFAARLSLPEDLPEHATKLGVSGSAMLITEEAGPVELLARILFWLSMQTNYL